MYYNFRVYEKYMKIYFHGTLQLIKSAKVFFIRTRKRKKWNMLGNSIIVAEWANISYKSHNLKYKARISIYSTVAITLNELT